MAFVWIALIGGTVDGLYSDRLADLFPTSILFSGIALDLSLATVIFTGVPPLVVMNAIRATGHLAAPGIYLSRLWARIARKPSFSALLRRTCR